ncbi:uncharacterized protein LOC110677043 [Aedes aegypti]|uniref:Uncharacterized protein n=1 Tax=Aedes aegypti TaxID=7159 RepID=A0A6I8TNN6_AEDAE|nr:uncharacterized protein LOC110677043 [Aedes aegypti]
MEKILSNFHTCSATTLLLLLLILPAQPLRSGVDPVIILGTFNSMDNVCLMKKIFKGQPSPATINFDSVDPINYARAFTEDGQKKSGKISMSLVQGAIGSNSISLQISETASKSVFKSNAFVEIRCMGAIIPVPVPQN